MSENPLAFEAASVVVSHSAVLRFQQVFFWPAFTGFVRGIARFEVEKCSKKGGSKVVLVNRS